MGRRARLLGSLAALVAMAAADDARATGALVASPPGSAQIADVHVAVASAEGRTTRWARLRVRGSATAFAWIVPVRPGAMVDRASDAWFEALDAATAPRVLAPASPPACSVIRAPEIVDGADHGPARAPSDIAVAKDEATLETALTSWGLALPSDLRARVAPSFAAGEDALALLFATGGDDTTTASVRVVDDAPPELPLAWTVSQTDDVGVTAYVVGTGRTDLGASAPLAVDPNAVLWNQDGTSTYKTARRALLTQAPSAWVVENASGRALFDLRPIPGGAIPPVIDGYFARAAAHGDVTGDYSICAFDADKERYNPHAVAVACPQGALARVDTGTGPPPCQETVASSQIAPGAFRCGAAADDLALALSGSSPSTAWITRARGVVSAGVYGSNVALRASALAEQSPTVSASAYSFACGGSPGDPGSGTTSGGGPGPSGGIGGGASDPGGVNAGAQVGVDVPADGTGDTTAADIADASSGCDCGGGTSGTADGSSADSCSSSSSSDSSSSDSCGSGSSSSGGSGDSCGGSSGGGDSCGGGGGGNGNCSTSRRSKRSPMSRMAVVVVAALALWRRRTRATMRA